MPLVIINGLNGILGLSKPPNPPNDPPNDPPNAGAISLLVLISEAPTLNVSLKRAKSKVGDRWSKWTVRGQGVNRIFAWFTV